VCQGFGVEVMVQVFDGQKKTLTHSMNSVEEDMIAELACVAGFNNLSFLHVLICLMREKTSTHSMNSVEENMIAELACVEAGFSNSSFLFLYTE